MKKVLPHKDVFCRVGVSKVHGVGVFAIIDIPKGTNPFKHSADRYRKYKTKDILKDLKPGIRKLYDDFCVIEGEDIWVPVNFNRMGVSWHLNHSKSPNVRSADKTGTHFYTLRAIKAGEELCSDYNTYCENGA
ncbi:MAG: SET domain-containing protein [Candidatus Firestonebacteria bacterium]